MFGGSAHQFGDAGFGGTTMPAGGGGYGGAAPPGGGYGGTAARPFSAGGFGMGGAPEPAAEAGGFMQAGANGAGFGAGAGGYGGAADGAGTAPDIGGGGESSQTLMPVTVRMLLDAVERRNSGPGGPDAPLRINARDVNMITLVACVEKSGMDQMFKVFHVNDGCGRVVVKMYAELDPTGTRMGDDDPQPGEYVRVYGSLRSFHDEFHISAHNIARIENPNELAYHFVEVAYVHLSLSGKIQRQDPPAGGRPAPVPVAAPAPAWGGGAGIPTSMGAPGNYGGAGGFGAHDLGRPGMAPQQPAFAGQSFGNPQTSFAY